MDRAAGLAVGEGARAVVSAGYAKRMGVLRLDRASPRKNLARPERAELGLPGARWFPGRKADDGYRWRLVVGRPAGLDAAAFTAGVTLSLAST
jgi:hypothetical protein